MQKGFASAEIILAALIISLLATVAVPKAVQLFDRAAVHYEQKRLYSELQFVRTLDRSATAYSTGMKMKDFLTSKMTLGKTAELHFDLRKNCYKILRDGKEIREPHYLSNGVKFSNETNVPDKIWFEPSGYLKSNGSNNSITIVLTSRRGYKSKIVLDSVGRIRGE